MTDEQIQDKITDTLGTISDIEAEIEQKEHYAIHILKDTSNLREQIQPLEDNVAKLEQQLKELYPLL